MEHYLIVTFIFFASFFAAISVFVSGAFEKAMLAGLSVSTSLWCVVTLLQKILEAIQLLAPTT